MAETNSTEVCPTYQSGYQGRSVSSVYFFLAYSAICLLALVGNSFIIGLLVRRPSLLQRRTFRFLTLVLSACELVEGVLLMLLLLRLGVGYHNRVTGSRLIKSSWVSETENGYDVRRPTLLRLLLSLRDFAIGAEIYVFGLLAVDRLLAIAAPTTDRWNCRVARWITGVGFAAMAAAELGLQGWRWTCLLLLHSGSDEAICVMVTRYGRVNTSAKAAVAVLNYLVSLTAYAATAALMISRARSGTPGCGGQSRHVTATRQTKWPLFGLVIGNLVQFVSLLPMVVDNVMTIHMDYSLYYCFFVSAAAIPCLTVMFNKLLRRALAKMLHLPWTGPAATRLG